VVSLDCYAERYHETARVHAPADWIVASLIRRWAGRIQHLRSEYTLGSSCSTAAAGSSEQVSDSGLVQGSGFAEPAGLAEGAHWLVVLNFGSRIVAASVSAQASSPGPVCLSGFGA
jgi:hypothetical protein